MSHFLSGPMFLPGGGMMSLPVWSYVPSSGVWSRRGLVPAVVYGTTPPPEQNDRQV